MQERCILSERQFAKIETVLSQERDRRGRKPKIPNRVALEGALYILREGCRWRALPAAFGPWMAVFMRYKRWVESGVWWKVLMALQKAGRLKVSVAFIDGSTIRAHRHAAGARIKRGSRRWDARAAALAQSSMSSSTGAAV